MTYAQRMCAFLVLACPVAACAASLAVPTPDQLPDNTWVVINWHGVDNATRARDTNPVLKLWYDPKFATARNELVERLAESVGKEDAGPGGRGMMEDLLSIFGNPLLLGVAGDPWAPGPDTVHMFAVLNRKGKEAEWARLHASEKPAANAQISTYSFRGTQVEKTMKTTMRPPTAGSDPTAPPKPRITTSFEATVGDYELYSTGQREMEALIARLKSNERSGTSLLNDPVWQRAQDFRSDGAMLEAFIRIPDLTRLPISPTPRIDAAAVLRELHLERAQGLWLSAGMGRDRMQVRGALLADMAPGSVLDLVGGNVPQFQTLAAASANGTFSAFRFDLRGLHAAALRAMKAGVPPDQGAAVSMMIDSLVMARTGMLTTRLLDLFTGEIGMVSNGSETDKPYALPAAIMLPLTDGDQLLATLRRVAEPLFAQQESVHGATVVRVGPGGNNPAPNTPGAFHVALSPNMLVISPDRTELDGVLARSTGNTASTGSLAADATFLSARKSLPGELNGISYTDFSRIDWDAHLEGLRQKLAKQKQGLLDRADGLENGKAGSPPDPAGAARLRKQAEDLAGFSQLLIEALPLAKEHLKFSIGGSWKAGDGVFLDSYVN